MVDTERVTTVLNTLGLNSPQIDVHRTGPGRIMVVLTSPSFRGMDEGKRQSCVWEAIADSFDADEQRSIEFVFTNAPEDTSDSNDTPP